MADISQSHWIYPSKKNSFTKRNFLILYKLELPGIYILLNRTQGSNEY